MTAPRPAGREVQRVHPPGWGIRLPGPQGRTRWLTGPDGQRLTFPDASAAQSYINGYNKPGPALPLHPAPLPKVL